MDKTTKPLVSAIGSKPGIYINGIVISSDARKVNLKDGTTRVSVKHELALDPGLISLDRFIDPKMNNEVKLVGDEIQEYPKLTKFEPIIVRVQKIKECNGQMTATDWELASN